MSNEAVSYGIVANDPLYAKQPRYLKIATAVNTAAKIYACHLDGEGRQSTLDSVMKQTGFHQQRFVKAVEHELDIHDANQSSTRPIGIAEMSLRIASDASFQMDNLRIHNAITLPEQKHGLGEAVDGLIEECRADTWKAKEIRDQARGDYKALPIAAQREVSDDIANMKHMSANTQEFAWNLAHKAEQAFDSASLQAAGPTVSANIPREHAVGR